MNYFFSKEIIFQNFNFFSKEIQKYDQRKFYLFSEKKNFQIWYSRSPLKKKSQKKCTIFFHVHPNYKTKKIAISKIFGKKIEKILKIIFAIFLFLKKKSVKSRLIRQSKDIKLSVNLGYFRLKHRLPNLPGLSSTLEPKRMVRALRTAV